MKLDLEDGRVLSLPDEVSDEFARQLKRLILATEERARAAEVETAAVREEMRALRAEMAAFMAAPRDTGVADAIGRMHEDHARAIARLEKAVRADRVMVPDEFGEYTRSRCGS